MKDFRNLTTQEEIELNNRIDFDDSQFTYKRNKGGLYMAFIGGDLFAVAESIKSLAFDLNVAFGMRKV